jgi:uncharacterized protein (UPF0332 family)
MLAFDWTKFLTLAQFLSKSQEESALRSAVSRAYYSAFIIALRRAEQQGYYYRSDISGGSHDQLWDVYDLNKNDATCVEIAKIGQRMKRRRHGADYRDFITRRWPQEATDTIRDAVDCHRLISQLGNGLPQDLRK